MSARLVPARLGSSVLALEGPQDDAARWYELIIDHVGLSPPHEPPPPSQALADLVKLLALARG